jgi:aryl-alcohol dehydrogenase-like predicted oxidoreductase
MRRRRLGRSGIEVSEIGFGAWGLGGDSYGPIEKNEAQATVRAALDAGVTFFDTSDLYGAGRSETLLGAALEGVRERVIVCSKVGLLPHSGFVMPSDFSAARLREGLAATLDRLRTRYLDIYLLHSPELETLRRDPEILAVMREFQEKGLVRTIGVSARSPADAKAMIEAFDTPVVQANYNMIDQRAADDGLFALAARRETGVIVRTPLCFGYLTGALSADSRFVGSDHRANWPADQLRRWAAAPDLFKHLYGGPNQGSAAQLALRFCLAQPAASTVIPGMMTPAEAAENAAAGAMPPLTAEETAEIRAVYAANTFYDNTAKQRGRQT